MIYKMRSNIRFRLCAGYLKYPRAAIISGVAASYEQCAQEDQRLEIEILAAPKHTRKTCTPKRLQEERRREDYVLSYLTTYDSRFTVSSSACQGSAGQRR